MREQVIFFCSAGAWQKNELGEEGAVWNARWLRMAGGFSRKQSRSKKTKTTRLGERQDQYAVKAIERIKGCFSAAHFAARVSLFEGMERSEGMIKAAPAASEPN